MKKPFTNFTSYLEYNDEGFILLNGKALWPGEIIKVFVTVDGKQIMYSAMAWRFVSKKYPRGVFILKGSFDEHFEKLRARRLLPNEFDLMMLSRQKKKKVAE